MNHKETSAMNIPHVIGAIVFILGCLLFAGNVLGFLPTFSYAGFISMTIGGSIWKAGND